MCNWVKSVYGQGDKVSSYMAVCLDPENESRVFKSFIF